MHSQHRPTLLKNATIIDGTGAPGFPGDVLIVGGSIADVAPKIMATEAETVDCGGRVVAPGFIDMHSHNDWFLPSPDQEIFTRSFLDQGITAFVGGNCGFSAASLDPESTHHRTAADNLFRSAGITPDWQGLPGYAARLADAGATTNMALLAGHGTARANICGFQSAPLDGDQRNRLLYTLEKTMDDGAVGVSLGLQYEPGIFAGREELLAVARLVKQKDKILTVHARALSALSGTYPLKPFGRAHNLLAIEEMLSIARETGVRLQFSHLIFVGKKSWSTLDEALSIFDGAIADGVDVKFDTYSHHCGASLIHVVLPGWFLAKVPEAYHRTADRLRLWAEMQAMSPLLGFGYGDILLTFADDDAFNAHNGRFVTDIAAARGTSNFRTFMDITIASHGLARVLMFRYSTPEIVGELMRQPASLFMTDAWIERRGIQNPAAFGAFPRFLQRVREEKIISLEAAVHKMTGAAADRFGLTGRGVLKRGNAADVVVFDAGAVADGTSLTATDRAPTGINHVFVNGVPMAGDLATPGKRPGSLLM
ncbi:MAG: amidohydrolase family protein [Pseudomonadota bacterium]